VEDNAISVLINTAHRLGIEIRKWHDGTRSDVGLRPLNVTEDCWYPLQIKSTAAVKPKFQWNLGIKLYHMPVVLMTGDPQLAFVLTPDELVNHRDKIVRNQGLVAYGIGGGYWKDVLPPSSISDILGRFEEQWRIERALPDNGQLATEYTLQMRCSIDSQREWFVADLSRKFSTAAVHSQPVHQSTTDRFEDGVRIQDKSAAWMPREDTPYFKAKCAKLLRGMEVPYTIDDADLYCFAVVLEQRRLLLEWRIPASSMDTMFGRLSHVENGKIIKLGRTCINLPIVGPSGENETLHRHIFGRMPRKDTDLRPALFLNIHSISDGVVLPACVRGRDPTPRD
jgi:hypothetical protein